MARCSYHPKIETELTCTECGKPICPKEMVLTPVGYKCPEHAKVLPSQYLYIKPKQILLATAASLAAGVGGAVMLVLTGFIGLFAGLLWGIAMSEVVRRASGGHRGGVVAVIAVGGVGAGWLATLPLGGIWFATPIVAAIAAAIQLAAPVRR